MRLSPLNQRRWRNFRRNGRAFWSLIIFVALFTLSLFAEFLANEKPILVSYRGGDLYAPIFKFYPETQFGGGDLRIEAVYRDPEIECLIITGGGVDACWDDPPELLIEDADDGVVEGEDIQKGWVIWPPIRYGYKTPPADLDVPAPSAPPDSEHWMGTDDTARDVLARVIYGFRLSVFFTIIVTILTTIIGIAAGAVQGYFGGRTDLIFQRALEIFTAIPSLYVIIILFAIFGRSFWLLVFVTVLFGWPAWSAWCGLSSCARATSNMCAPPAPWVCRTG